VDIYEFAVAAKVHHPDPFMSCHQLLLMARAGTVAMGRRLVTTWYGTFLMVDDGNVLASSLFPKNVEEISDRLALIRGLEVLDEERRVAPRDGTFVVTEDRLLSLDGAELADADAPMVSPPAPEDVGFAPGLLRKASLNMATAAIRDALPPDQPVVLYLRAMDLVEKEATRAVEMLRYWHSFHFPELGALVDEAKFLELLSVDPQRAEILRTVPELDPGVDSGRALSDGEGEAMASMARHLVASRAEGQLLREALEGEVTRAAPNLCHVAGPLVGARLISLAGSLERLSRLPSSTAQLLGAEKALFLHIKEGVPPPKHGVVFQHPSVHSSPPWLRGRTARALAGKIVIAARADMAGSHPEGDLGIELREQFLDRVRQLRRDHPEPPPGWRRPRPRPRGDPKGRKRGGGRGKARRSGPARKKGARRRRHRR
jgi:nucleolar protein 56